MDFIAKIFLTVVFGVSILCAHVNALLLKHFCYVL